MSPSRPRVRIPAAAVAASILLTLCGAVGASADDARSLGPAGGAAGPAPLVARAASVHRRTERVGRYAATLLDEARRGHDVLRVHCLDRTLSEVNALLRMQDARIAELRAALAPGGEARASRYASVLSVWDRRTRELHRQAGACIGAADVGESGTVVVVTWDATIPFVDVPAIAATGDATTLYGAR